jgi:hypothetical protein
MTHTVVFAVVDAPTEDRALDAAQTAFDRLAGTAPERDRVFDYCLTLDEVDPDHPARAAGIPTAARVADDRGTVLLGAAWAVTVEETREAVERARAALADHDPNAIRRNEDGTRDLLARLAHPERPPTALYDANGLGLVCRDRVVDIVTTADEPWIVPGDAHHHP